MVTKELVKDEIDKVPDKHLPMLLRIVRAFEEEPAEETPESLEEEAEAWRQFVASTYGSLADTPIDRGEIPPAEDREPLR